jgi:hypothetical protein
VWPSASWYGVGTPDAIISQLNGRPAGAPVNASMAASRLATHDSGSGWIATPFLCDSFIHDSTPVYPGAHHGLLRPHWLDHQPNADAKPRQHVDQSIGAEQIDAPAKEIADPGLCDPKHLRRFYLLKAPRRDSFLNLNQQVSTNECSDSSFENPRSRKTFPVDGVTLTLLFAMLVPQLL